MGRHSAPDDDADDRSDAAVAVINSDIASSPGSSDVAGASAGRHSRPAAPDAADAPDPAAVPDAADASAVAVAAPRTGTVSDGGRTSSHPAPGRPKRLVRRPERAAPRPTTETASTDVAEAATSRIPPITERILDRAVPAEITQQIPAVVERAVEPVVEQEVVRPPEVAAPLAGTEPPPTVSPKSATHATQADLHLIRDHRDVLARAVAAVIVPFVIYVVVLFVLDDVTVRRLLIWIWAPLVAAGILLGVVLDAGHRRYAKPKN